MLTVIDTVLSAKSFPGEDELYELLVVEALTTTGTRILSIAKLTTPRNSEKTWKVNGNVSSEECRNTRFILMRSIVHVLIVR
jgi:hypothetical protein